MRLKYYLKLIKRISIIEIYKLLEYKVNFVIIFSTTILEITLYILFWRILFLNNSTLNGWGFHDMVLIMFFVYFFYIFNEILGSAIHGSFKEIVTGNFDRYLLYPQNPIFNLSFNNKINLSIMLSNLIFTIIIFVYIIQYFTIKLILIGSLFMISGFIIFFLFIFILLCSSFWTKNSEWVGLVQMMNFFLNRYPMTITNKVLQFILMFIIPLIFIATIPAEIVRGNFNLNWIFYEIFMIGLLLIVSKIIWRKGLKQYESGMG